MAKVLASTLNSFRYAVAKGRETGVYTSWPECQNQVNGYKGAVFKSFTSRAEAEAFCKGRGGHSTNVRAPVFKSKPSNQNRAASHSISIPTESLDGYEAQMVRPVFSHRELMPPLVHCLQPIHTQNQQVYACSFSMAGHVGTLALGDVVLHSSTVRTGAALP